MRLISVFLPLMLLYTSIVNGQSTPKPAKIIFGFDKSHPPYEFVNEDGKSDGFNIDLIKAIGKSQGIEVVPKPDEWENARRDLEVEGTIDVIAAYESEERDELMDFSNPFTVIYNELFARVNSKEIRIDSLSQLKGKEVIVERYAFLYEYLTSNHPGVKTIKVASEVDALELLASGKHDLAFVSHAVGNYIISEEKIDNIARAGGPFLTSRYCFAVKEGNKALKLILSEGLVEVKASGEYDKIYEKWFGNLNRKTVLTEQVVLYLLWVTIAIVGVFTFFYAWNKSLEHTVKKRTKELNKELKLRKEAELKIKSLAQSEINQLNQKLLAFISKNPLGFIETDKAGTIKHWNKASEKIFGYNKVETVGKNIFFLLLPHENGYPNQKDNESRFLAEGDKGQVNVNTTKDGGKLVCKWYNTPITDEEDKVVGWTCLVEDITESKKTQEKIEKANEVLKLQNVELERQKKEILIQSNTIKETQAQLIQAEKMAVLGQLIAGIAHEINTPLGAVKASVEMIIEAFPEIIDDLPKFFKTSSEQEISLFSQFLHDVSQHNAFYSSREERAERKKLSRFLQEEKIEYPEETADMLADLKFFNGLEPYFPLLRKKGSLQTVSLLYSLSMQMKNSENIKMAVEKAAKVIYALKSYGRSENTEELSEASLKENIQTVLTLYHNQIKHGVEVIENYNSHDELKIKCYPDQLNQVWANIIHNSIQAMNGNGTLSISVETTDDCVNVAIQDSGKGIPEDIHEKVLQPFFTTKKVGEGSGLGLDIANKIMKRHAGSLSFTSKPGATVFTITIPKKEFIEAELKKIGQIDKSTSVY